MKKTKAVVYKPGQLVAVRDSTNEYWIGRVVRLTATQVIVAHNDGPSGGETAGSARFKLSKTGGFAHQIIGKNQCSYTAERKIVPIKG